MTSKPGLIASALVGILLLAFAVSVDFPKANGDRFKGDESTYYMLAHSLARDFDFQYQRKDLIRVWEEFSGPAGVFLKTGKDVEIRGSSSFPFFRWLKREDPSRETRLYFSKSYIYPLAAAPFVMLFGTNGFLVLHAILIALDLLAIYLFLLAATRSNWAALPMSIAFLATSVVPVYFVWLTPELFNFSLVLYAVFFWAYKEVAGEATHRTCMHAHSLRSGIRLRCGGAARTGDVLQAATRAGPRADSPARRTQAAVGARSRSPRDMWSRECVVIRGQCRHHGRVQLPGRRSKDLLLLHRISVCEHLGDLRQHRPGARARRSHGWRRAGQHALRHRSSSQPVVLPLRPQRRSPAVLLSGHPCGDPVSVLEAEASVAVARARDNRRPRGDARLRVAVHMERGRWARRQPLLPAVLCALSGADSGVCRRRRRDGGVRHRGTFYRADAAEPVLCLAAGGRPRQIGRTADAAHRVDAAARSSRCPGSRPDAAACWSSESGPADDGVFSRRQFLPARGNAAQIQ